MIDITIFSEHPHPPDPVLHVDDALIPINIGRCGPVRPPRTGLPCIRVSLPGQQCHMAYDVRVCASGAYGALCKGGLCWYWMVRTLMTINMPMLIFG